MPDSDTRRRTNRRLLADLADLWDVVPDQRFGQLIMNLSREEGGFSDTWEWSNRAWRERITAAWSGWARELSDIPASNKEKP